MIQTLTSILPFITLILAILSGYAAAKINRKNKIADVVMHCMARYDAIAQDKAKIKTREEVLYYFRRYYGLKSDQFDYWLSGLIDAENILSWFYSIIRAFETNKTVSYLSGTTQEKITFSEGWELVRDAHLAQDTTFVNTIEKLREIAKTPLGPKEKFDQLLDLFITIEEEERFFIRFTEVSFLFMRIRGGNMRSFKKMEEKTNKLRKDRAQLRPASLE
jgi:hypothetical protein